MASVRLSGPTNSTMFTTCCGVAILEHQAQCPKCREDVWPTEATSHATHRARWEVAYGPTRRAMAARNAGAKP